MDHSPQPEKQPGRRVLWIMAVVTLATLAVAFYLTHPPSPSPKQRALRYLYRFSPPGSILAVHYVQVIDDLTDGDESQFKALVKATVDRRAYGKDPACSGTLDLDISVRALEKPISLRESFLRLLKSKVWEVRDVQDASCIWIDLKTMYRFLATDPSTTSRPNLLFDLACLNPSAFNTHNDPSDREYAILYLYESLLNLGTGSLEEAANLCYLAAQYAIVGGLEHEYEHVRKLVIAKLPKNYPDPPPTLDEYNSMRKDMGLPPLKRGMKIM